jgi:hypothetical protein
MLSYVVIHRCADKKLHDNKLNMQNVTVNTVFTTKETELMTTGLLALNNRNKLNSSLGEVFGSSLTKLAAAAAPKHTFDSALGKKLPLYTVTCIE